jgi:hypothetical protein
MYSLITEYTAKSRASQYKRRLTLARLHTSHSNYTKKRDVAARKKGGTRFGKPATLTFRERAGNETFQ